MPCARARDRAWSPPVARAHDPCECDRANDATHPTTTDRSVSSSSSRRGAVSRPRDRDRTAHIDVSDGSGRSVGRGIFSPLGRPTVRPTVRTLVYNPLYISDMHTPHVRARARGRIDRRRVARVRRVPHACDAAIKITSWWAGGSRAGSGLVVAPIDRSRPGRAPPGSIARSTCPRPRERLRAGRRQRDARRRR